jgi:hypothetical protein
MLITVPTLIVCGTHLLPLYGAIFLFQTWGFINHANVRLDLGKLSILVSAREIRCPNGLRLCSIVNHIRSWSFCMRG